MDKEITLARRLFKQAKAENKTQKDIAEHLGISQPFVSDILAGKKQANGDLFEKLVAFLGFKLDERTELEFQFLKEKSGFSDNNPVIKAVRKLVFKKAKEIDYIFELAEKEIPLHKESYLEYIRQYIIAVTFFIDDSFKKEEERIRLIADYNRILSVFKILPDKLKKQSDILSLLAIAKACNKLLD